MKSAWRYRPLDGFALGDGPFRVRGLAYAGALRYVDKKLPGGRAALDAALADAAHAVFFDQIFLAISDYDISPLLRLYSVAARLEGVPVERFIEARARWSGSADPKGIWKQPLSGATPGEVAARLYFAFNRYFPPCVAEARSADAGEFAGELSRVPACMNGLYAQSTVGFFIGALEGAGAHGVRVEFADPIPDAPHAAIPTERLRFTVRWT